MNSSPTTTPRLTITPDHEDSFYLPMDSVPLVILFCHRSDERTALVSRLSDYLQSQGYTIHSDSQYHPECRIYHEQYSLLEVHDNMAKPVCRIMEFPERYLFDSRLFYYKMMFYQFLDVPIRKLLNHIFQLPCTRLWIFMPNLHELRKGDRRTYKYYIHWLIDYIYPDQMMGACPEEEVSFAREIDNRYTFDFPIFNTDTMDICALWESILHAIHP